MKKESNKISIYDIINKHPKSEWENLIKENFDYIEDKTYIYNQSDALHLRFTFDDLKLKRFPFEVGDKVRLKDVGGEYTIVHLPWLDERSEEDLKSEKEGTIYDCISMYGNTYWLEGKTNEGYESGTEYDSQKPNAYLTTDQCVYQNMEKIN